MESCESLSGFCQFAFLPQTHNLNSPTQLFLQTNQSCVWSLAGTNYFLFASLWSKRMVFHQHAFRRLGFASCDGSFGPFAADCPGGRFDFTLLFELVVFEIVPSVILLMLVPFRIFRLVGQRPKVSASFGLYLKMVCDHLALILRFPPQDPARSII